MIVGSVSTVPDERRARRLTGRWGGTQPGPTVIVLGGIHGNEPAGVEAQRRVLARLERERMPLRGELVALAGNLGALADGVRFHTHDLNRRWTADGLERLRARDARLDDDEDREQRDLLEQFEGAVQRARGPVVFVDLHTSSADGPPFCCLGDTLPNRAIAFALPMPVILGLEETIDGAALEYFNDRGLAGIAIEGGQHQSPATIDNLEAALWIVLVATGALPAQAIPDLERYRRVLRTNARGAPHVVEVRDHHRIGPSDGFVMRPGYRSFQPVHKGEVLAADRNGDVRAIEDGLVLLPLYQGLGEDGFFLVRRVHRFWLGVARWMRYLHLHVLLSVLPGVRRHPTRPDALLVDPRVARWLVREVFHLLGFRRCRPSGDKLVFSRRRVAKITKKLPWR